MKLIQLTSGKFQFLAKLEEERSPQTCKWLVDQLPWEVEMRHVSWSGSACFADIGRQAHHLPFEAPIRIPSKGEIIVYPGNIPHLQMMGEFFLAWGPCSIACQNGNLMGNLVLTIIEGQEQLAEFGTLVHLGGLQKLQVTLKS